MTSTRLWYRGPAESWVEALPVGNGRLGAMVFGGIASERFQLNEDTLWIGGPEDADNPAAYPALAEIRRLAFAGRYAEAQRLTDETQIRKPSSRGAYGSFTTLGELELQHRRGAERRSASRDYERELDLAQALAVCRYRHGDTQFFEECFASFPDQVLVLHLRSEGSERLDFSLQLARPEAEATPRGDDTLGLSGQLVQRTESDGMRFQARVRVRVEAGRVQADGHGLEVSGARSATLIVAAGTDYRGPGFEAELGAKLEAACSRGYDELRARHVADHAALFSRAAVELPAVAGSSLPTDERLLAQARGADDPEICALYFNLGRYLLIGSSRPGSMAANLQGVWAEGLTNPWDGDYHTNINLQMNYWLAETAQLGECAEPLVDLIEGMREPGRQTASVHYRARGWVVHTVHNVWGFTAPGEKPLWGLFPMAGAWLCQHLWEHYAFGGDRQFLERVWPWMKEATEFCLDWLVVDPNTGRLVSGPANSPENTFITPDGERCSISMGPTMDQAIAWDHFGNVLEAADALGLDDDWVGMVAVARDRLLAPRVGSDGRLQEWAEPFEEAEPQHRHVSHLFGLHPGRQITPHGSPELARAARATLEARGDEATGWSRAWKICFWARLHDGERAWRLIRQLFTPVRLRDSEYADDGAGVYPNLMCAHPPFQIDGNFGAAAGMLEMLLQSHDGSIRLLPALPRAWHAGRARGLSARGGFVVDLWWAGDRLEQVVLHSRSGRRCTLRYGDRSSELDTRAGESYVLDGQLAPLDESPPALVSSPG